MPPSISEIALCGIQSPRGVFYTAGMASRGQDGCGTFARATRDQRKRKPANMANTLLIPDGPGLKQRIARARRMLHEIDLADSQGNKSRFVTRVLQLGDLLS